MWIWFTGQVPKPLKPVWELFGPGTGWTWAYLGAAQTQSTPVTATDVVDFEGNATEVDVTYNALSRGAYGTDSIQSTSLPATDGHDMMEGYFTTQGMANSVTISDLGAGLSYDLYLFGHGDNEAQNTQFTVAGETKGSTIDVTGLGLLTEDAHYVVFTAVEADENGEILIEYANGPDNEWGSFNGMQITHSAAPRGAAHSPSPSGDEVNATGLTSVSWYSPEQDEYGDPFDDPNIVSIQGYDVYWSTTEPNYLSAVPVSALQTEQSFAPTDLVLIRLHMRQHIIGVLMPM